MQWIQTNGAKVLLAIAALFAVVCVMQYFQMGQYNNYDKANWQIVLGWGFASAGLGTLSLALHRGLTDSQPLEAARPVVNPSYRTSSTGPVQQVTVLRERAESAHKYGDELNAQAADLVAKMEAELVAAKKLLGGGK